MAEAEKKALLKMLLEEPPNNNVMRGPASDPQENKLKSAIARIRKTAPVATKTADQPIPQEKATQPVVDPTVTQNAEDPTQESVSLRDLIPSFEDYKTYKAPESDSTDYENIFDNQPDKNGKINILREALIPAITTGIGSIFGGWQGGALGAEAGGKFIKTKTDLAEQERKKASDLNRQEIAAMEKGYKYNPQSKKYEVDFENPYWKEQDINAQAKIAQIAALFGKEEATKVANEYQKAKFEWEKKYKEKELELKANKKGDVAKPQDEFKSLSKESQIMVNKLADQKAKSTIITNMMSDLFNQLNDPNVKDEQKAASALEQLKQMNSQLGADALGEGETGRASIWLQNKPDPLRGKYTIGPDIEKFKIQLQNAIKRNESTIFRMDNQINSIYGRPLSEQPKSSFIETKPSQPKNVQQKIAPKAERMQFGGKTYELPPGKDRKIKSNWIEVK